MAEDAEGTFEEIPDDEGIIPEEVMQDKEKQRLFREIIDSLSDMQRLCVIGYYYNEQSQESLAEELGIPVGTVKSHLNRARARIKLAVEELDVKKDTRLYNVAPLVLVLMEEEIKSCIIKPMSAALAAGVGAGKGTAEGFSIVRKLKALWAKLSAGAKAKAAVAAVAACTVGAVAAVAFTQDETQIPVISDEEREVFDQIIEIYKAGNYEELCLLDYSVIDSEKDYLGGNHIAFKDGKGRLMGNYYHGGEKPYAWYYGGADCELKRTFTGYGIIFPGSADNIVVGYFEDGQVTGKCIVLGARILYDETEEIKNTPAGQEDTRVFLTEMNVEGGVIVGDVVEKTYQTDKFGQPYLQEMLSGSVVPVHLQWENGINYMGYCYDGRVKYESNYSSNERYTYYFYVEAGCIDAQRHLTADGKWVDESGQAVYVIQGILKEGERLDFFTLNVGTNTFNWEGIEITDVQETE